MKKFFEELSRRLREGGVESSNVEDRRLEIFLHGQPVLFVSPGNDVFLFPAGSNNPEASELYHRVAQTADEVYTYSLAAFPVLLSLWRSFHRSAVFRSFSPALDLGKRQIFKQKTPRRYIPRPGRSCWLYSVFIGS